jgi:hypothetical protein
MQPRSLHGENIFKISKTDPKSILKQVATSLLKPGPATNPAEFLWRQAGQQFKKSIEEKKMPNGKSKKNNKKKAQSAKASAKAAKKQAAAASRKAGQAAKKAAKSLKGKIRPKYKPGKASRTRSAALGVRGGRPKLLQMNMNAGLTMKGGVISGVTEITSDLRIDASVAAAGYVLATVPLNPLAIAPGTRLADFAALYDMFCFEECQLCLEPDLPYTDSIMLGGGFEADSTDALPEVGQFIFVEKYMEHSNFHAETLLRASTSPAKFPRNRNAVRQGGKGPRGGFFYNRPPGNQDLNDVQQGWLVIFVHTADQGSLSGDVLSLGPLTMKWTLRFRDAAERNQFIAQEDYHLKASPPPDIRNPLQWTGTDQLQASLQSTSTIEIPGKVTTVNSTSGQVCLTLPQGTWDIRMWVSYDTLGSGSVEIDPFTPAGTTLLNNDTSLCNSFSSSNTTLMAFTRLKVAQDMVSSQPILNLVYTATAGYHSNYCGLVIHPAPGNSIAYKHPDLKLRSSAWLAHTTKNRTQQLVREELIKMGQEVKEDKKDEHAWEDYLKRKNEQMRTRARAVRPKLELLALSEDDEDEDPPQRRSRRLPMDPEEHSASIRSERAPMEERKFKVREPIEQPPDEKDPVISGRMDKWLKLKAHFEEDEKGERQKPAERRASSLKS